MLSLKISNLCGKLFFSLNFDKPIFTVSGEINWNLKHLINNSALISLATPIMNLIPSDFAISKLLLASL